MDVFGLSAKLVLDSSQYEQGLNQAEGLGQRFARSISARTVAIGQIIGNLATSAITNTASMIKQLVGDSIGEYANFEQLVGGVETLFGAGGKSLEEYVAETKDSSQKNIDAYKRMIEAQELVLANADRAYKTAGISANQYMEMSTSFAASLVSSLRGDTLQAAQYADMAMQDMADNANKMGTDISAIQVAYQGFSKQNYTMLDNLKLGYGGTKTEMERLLADAMKLTGKKYNLSNLADVYEAIHVIQEELGITGTTAKEAEQTISGSIGMMKAAWQNLLTALGDPNADINARIDTFTDSFKTVVNNLYPAFKRVVTNIWKGLKTTAKNLPGLVFGRKEDGTVDWPTWDTVKAEALKAWGKIKAKALELAGLVFGKKKDGTVNWPTWDSVQASATKVWNKIKEKALELAGLVFGKKEDGTVNWPTWDTVGVEAGEIWKDIKNQVAKFGGLVFGENEDGSVKLPSVNDVVKKAEEIYAEIKKGVEAAIRNIGEITFEIGSGFSNATGLTAIQDFGEFILTNQQGIEDALKLIGSQLAVFKISSMAVSGITTLQTFFQTIAGLSLSGFAGNITTIGGVLPTLVGKIPMLSLSLWLLIPALVEISKNTEAIGKGWELFKETASKAIEDVKTKVQELWESLQKFVNDLVSGKLFANLGEKARNSIVGFINEKTGLNIPMFDMDNDGVTVDMSGVTSQANEAASSIELASADLAELDGSSANVSVNVQAKIPKWYEILGSIFGGGGGDEGNAYVSNDTLGPSSFAERHRHAKGLWSVPYDDYFADLHRGEMVLTASQARDYREERSGGQNLDVQALAEAMMSAVREGMNGATVNSYISGRAVTDDVNRNTLRQLKARRFAT